MKVMGMNSTSDGLAVPDGHTLEPIDPRAIPPGTKVEELITITDDDGTVLFQGFNLSPDEIDRIANEIAQNLTQSNTTAVPSDVTSVPAKDTKDDSVAITQTGDTGGVGATRVSIGGGVLPKRSRDKPLRGGAVVRGSTERTLREEVSSSRSRQDRRGSDDDGRRRSSRPRFPSETVIDFSNSRSRTRQPG